MVYAIGLQTTVLRGPGGGGGGGIGGMTGWMTSIRPDPGLATVADETGGGYFELTRGDNLGTTFARVAEELHRQYVSVSSRDAGRQDAQARSPREPARDEGACPEELLRAPAMKREPRRRPHCHEGTAAG